MKPSVCSLRDTLQAAALFTQLGNQDNLNFELRHKAIIDGFGRYARSNCRCAIGWIAVM